MIEYDLGVSKNSGTPKSSILIGFSIILTIHFAGNTPIFGKHPFISCVSTRRNLQQNWSNWWPVSLGESDPRHWSCLCDGRLRWWRPDSPAGGEIKHLSWVQRVGRSIWRHFIHIYVLYIYMHDHLWFLIIYVWKSLGIIVATLDSNPAVVYLVVDVCEFNESIFTHQS